MKNFTFCTVFFGFGFLAGYSCHKNERTLKDIIAKEKKAIDKFKKNPKNKGFLKIFNKK